jgi:hypothetical protein
MPTAMLRLHNDAVVAVVAVVLMEVRGVMPLPI